MTSTSPPSGAPLNIALLAGPQVLGFFLNWALQGVLTVQVYIYYLCFPNDPWYSKSFVFGLLAYEWVQTGLVTSAAFDVYVYGFGSIEALITFHNTWFSVPIMCAVVSATVQIYFGWRIHKLSKSRILAGIITALALTQGSAGIAGGIKLHLLPSSADQSSTTPAIATWLGGSALVDVVIAVSMTILLLRAKTGLKQSDDMINRLVRLVVESGTLTAVVAIIDVSLFAALPKTLLHECPALLLTKLYANTLVTNFNNRAFLKRGTMVVTSSTSGRGAIGSRLPEVDNENVPGKVRVDVSRQVFSTHDIALQDVEHGKYSSSSMVPDV